METEVAVLSDGDEAKRPLSERDGSVISIQGEQRVASVLDIWEQDKIDIHYGVDESPPLSLCVLLGFQVSCFHSF